MRKKRGSLEKGLVSSSSSGLWSKGNGMSIPPDFGYSPDLLEHKDGCFSRIPYSSLMAFMMCFVGVTLFSVLMVWSFNATVEQTRRVLSITDIPWLDKVHIMFFITAFAMIAVSFGFLGVGILSTGSTRQEIYYRRSSRRGGRILCIISISLAYLLNILWIVLVALTAIFSFMYFVFSEVCAALPNYSEENCLDFSVFRPLVKEFSDASLVLCSGNAQQFCALTNTVLVWYAVGFISSFVVCLGLMQFIASTAANYAHIGGEEKHREMQEILLTETSAISRLGIMPNSGNSYYYGSGPEGKKFSSGKLMDYQVNTYPSTTIKHQPYASNTMNNGGTLQKNYFGSNSHLQTIPPPPPFQPQYPKAANGNSNSRTRKWSGSPFNEPPQQIAMRRLPGTVGGAINAARRNSYHNSLKDDYNSFVY